MAKACRCAGNVKSAKACMGTLIGPGKPGWMPAALARGPGPRARARDRIRSCTFQAPEPCPACPGSDTRAEGGWRRRGWTEGMGAASSSMQAGRLRVRDVRRIIFVSARYCLVPWSAVKTKDAATWVRASLTERTGVPLATRCVKHSTRRSADLRAWRSALVRNAPPAAHAAQMQRLTGDG